jgi:transcriptional regulator with XRE-family HTH domain
MSNRKKKVVYAPLLKVKAKMVEKSMNQEEMAAELNMSIATFNRKVNGLTDFTLTELKKIAEILDIGGEKYQEYFFAS